MSRILVLYDTAEHAESYAKMLRRVYPSHEVIAAGNVEEGKNQLTAHPDIAAILMDYDLMSQNAAAFLKDFSRTLYAGIEPDNITRRNNFRGAVVFSAANEEEMTDFYEKRGVQLDPVTMGTRRRFKSQLNTLPFPVNTMSAFSPEGQFKNTACIKEELQSKMDSILSHPGFSKKI